MRKEFTIKSTFSGVDQYHKHHQIQKNSIFPKCCKYLYNIFFLSLWTLSAPHSTITFVICSLEKLERPLSLSSCMVIRLLNTRLLLVVAGMRTRCHFTHKYTCCLFFCYGPRPANAKLLVSSVSHHSHHGKKDVSLISNSIGLVISDMTDR